MTEDRALKRTVRRRMELSGEKYTMARRALEGGPGDGQRYPWLYAPYWDELVEKFERDRVQRGEAVARAGIYSVLNGHQLFSVLTAFQVIAAGRSPSGPDFWLAQRPSIEGNAATIDLCAPLSTVGFAAEIDRNRRILDRMLTLIDIRSAGASEPSRAMAAKEREVIGVRGRRSAAAGRRMRDYKLRARQLPHPPVDDSHHLHLRAPLGDGFRYARRGLDDPELLVLLDAWIDELDRNYSALVDGMPVAWHRHGELEFEAVAGDADLLGSRTAFLSPSRRALPTR